MKNKIVFGFWTMEPSDYLTITDFTSFRRQRSGGPQTSGLIFLPPILKMCRLFQILLTTLFIRGYLMSHN